MLKAMQALGYKDVDLNAGCPWPFVAKKGRGSGLLKDEKVLAAMLEAGCETLGPGHFSIKVRLGLEDKELLLKRLDTIQSFPLRELCVHPRTAKQMYEGTVDLDAFARVAERVTLPLVYNGDIRTFEDVQRLQARFPQIERWMLGRGIVANPFLAESILAGEDRRDRERFLAWHETIFEGYAQGACGDHALLGHMKELWSYLAPTFEHGDRLWDSLKLTRSRDEFRRVLSLAPLHFKRV
jgi:tRNA-dihydrouridine synthase